MTNDKAGFLAQSWVPVFTGFSSPPSGGSYRYYKTGTLVTLFIRQTNSGTSNSSAFTISLPFPAASGGGLYGSPCQLIAGGSIMGYAQISAGASIMNIYTNYNGDGTPTSGSKRVNELQISYETDS